MTEAADLPPRLGISPSVDDVCGDKGDDDFDELQPKAISPTQWSRQPVALANTLLVPNTNSTGDAITPQPVKPQAVRLVTCSSGSSAPSSGQTQIISSSDLPLAKPTPQAPRNSIGTQSLFSSSLSKPLSSQLHSLHSQASGLNGRSFAGRQPSEHMTNHQSFEAIKSLSTTPSLTPATSLRPALSLKPTIKIMPSRGNDDAAYPRITAPVGNTNLSRTGHPVATFTASSSEDSDQASQPGTHSQVCGIEAVPSPGNSVVPLKQTLPDITRGAARPGRADTKSGAFQRSPAAQKAQKLSRSLSSKIGRLPSFRARQASNAVESSPVGGTLAQSKPKTFREISAAPLRSPAPTEIRQQHAPTSPPPIIVGSVSGDSSEPSCETNSENQNPADTFILSPCTPESPETYDTQQGMFPKSPANSNWSTRKSLGALVPRGAKRTTHSKQGRRTFHADMMSTREPATDENSLDVGQVSNITCPSPQRAESSKHTLKKKVAGFVAKRGK